MCNLSTDSDGFCRKCWYSNKGKLIIGMLQDTSEVNSSNDTDSFLATDGNCQKRKDSGSKRIAFYESRWLKLRDQYSSRELCVRIYPNSQAVAYRRLLPGDVLLLTDIKLVSVRSYGEGDVRAFDNASYVAVASENTQILDISKWRRCKEVALPSALFEVDELDEEERNEYILNNVGKDNKENEERRKKIENETFIAVQRRSAGSRIVSLLRWWISQKRKFPKLKIEKSSVPGGQEFNSYSLQGFSECADTKPTNERGVSSSSLFLYTSWLDVPDELKKMKRIWLQTDGENSSSSCPLLQVTSIAKRLHYREAHYVVCKVKLGEIVFDSNPKSKEAMGENSKKRKVRRRLDMNKEEIEGELQGRIQMTLYPINDTIPSPPTAENQENIRADEFFAFQKVNMEGDVMGIEASIYYNPLFKTPLPTDRNNNFLVVKSLFNIFLEEESWKLMENEAPETLNNALQSVPAQVMLELFCTSSTECKVSIVAAFPM
eukprot:g1165.t1